MDRIAVLMGQEKRRSFKETLDIKIIKIENILYGSQRRAKEEIARKHCAISSSRNGPPSPFLNLVFCRDHPRQEWCTCCKCTRCLWKWRASHTARSFTYSSMLRNPDVGPAIFFKALVVWAAKKLKIRGGLNVANCANRSHVHSKWYFKKSCSCPPPNALLPNTQLLFYLFFYQVKT